jgi:carbon monoxide dehydrogenase subunit G
VEIEDSFRVDLPVDDTWNLLMDIERIAPCLPGAQLQEVAGDEYRGVVKVKVGPITAQYKGTAHVESRDDADHTAVIVGSGRDTRGQGNASASIRMQCTPAGDGTEVTVLTELSITGKVAQFGRGVMADVSAKLLAQFVANLERDVLTGPEVDLTAIEAEPESAADAGGVGRDSALAGAPSGNGALHDDSEVVVRRIDAPEVDPVDLLDMGGGSVLKRLLPLVLGVLVVLVVLRRRRSARRR